jgi:hypothetical protein
MCDKKKSRTFIHSVLMVFALGLAPSLSQLPQSSSGGIESQMSKLDRGVCRYSDRQRPRQPCAGPRHNVASVTVCNSDNLGWVMTINQVFKFFVKTTGGMQ